MTDTFDAMQTARLLPYDRLVDTLAATMLDYAAGRILSPERMVVPLAHGGVMLSMPATAADIAMHKLVNVCAGNGALGLPTIHGQVSAFDARTGALQFMLDGPTVTGRRTAAVSMLAIRTLAVHAPRAVLVIGTGKQALHHVEALASLYPEARIHILGSRPGRAGVFFEENAGLCANMEPVEHGSVPDAVDVVITATTSKTPVYGQPANPARLVIGVGAFTSDAAEIASSVIHASELYVDDLAGARHEAGDYILAGVDWNAVTPLSSALSARNASGRPVVFKSVGCAAWDLAACRVARAVLSDQKPDA
ncbi:MULTISPECIES: bifunctional Delta(1)-pyrroline-2-carboxylate/Delta(1)-piperideine-2-carboxylate reductase [unclassified Caballeronia]|uniref:bifunctional Delta(1)-pyrroline-2-carboxylate/Delta(1)-piperideine-2- carboxylate reductase n=1 Tax=unclassified Caballeronia TaxID=2646786 RepID=UPI00286607DB|nr:MULTISPECIES: bifunctional Delta(1)-pyrroline-2-carboxylate/Delta(1)-piperideine-2-carboxylate reductase [unclassified Caballeronia]MDR5739356.1 delta(1)-pyrroline-2-carboxylate reductase family protein [Caballeronia sp. LZ016]MDR5807845.1 delta(1)-pyrroline-2-carboxylate reductase family protein [Caballeronia sp. LZ019]